MEMHQIDPKLNLNTYYQKYPVYATPKVKIFVRFTL